MNNLKEKAGALAEIHRNMMDLLATRINYNQQTIRNLIIKKDCGGSPSIFNVDMAEMFKWCRSFVGLTLEELPVNNAMFFSAMHDWLETFQMLVAITAKSHLKQCKNIDITRVKFELEGFGIGPVFDFSTLNEETKELVRYCESMNETSQQFPLFTWNPLTWKQSVHDRMIWFIIPDGKTCTVKFNPTWAETEPLEMLVHTFGYDKTVVGRRNPSYVNMPSWKTEKISMSFLTLVVASNFFQWCRNLCFSFCFEAGAKYGDVLWLDYNHSYTAKLTGKRKELLGFQPNQSGPITATKQLQRSPKIVLKSFED